MPQRLSLLAIAALWSVVHASVAGAEVFNFTWHEAQGSGCANVFDGGPPDCHSVDLVGVQHASIDFGAIDSTQPGSLGALAIGSGQSRLIVFDEGIGISVDLTAAYVPSFFPNGDNPGGTANAELFSIIEFTMPSDEIIWAYQLRIDQTINFEGSTHVLFENVTQGQTILETTTEIFPPIETTLQANVGDVMRITSTMQGSGSTGPASVREYDVFLGMTFIIPEPATLTLLLFALPVLPRRRR